MSVSTVHSQRFVLEQVMIGGVFQNAFAIKLELIYIYKIPPEGC